VSVPAGADQGGTGAQAPQQVNIGRPTLTNDQTSTYPSPGAPGPATDYNTQIAAEQAKYNSLAHPNGGLGNFTPDNTAVNASAQRLSDLKNQQAAHQRGMQQQTAQANPSAVGPTGAPVLPASAPGATQGSFAGNTPADAVVSAQQDLTAVQSELARLKGNDPITQERRQILQQEIVKAQQVIAQAGQVPQGNSAGAPPQGIPAPTQAQPSGPTGPGQTYAPPAGAATYNFDAQQAALQQQQLQRLFQMAQWKAQNAPTADQRAQAQQMMGEMQTAAQQLNGKIFSDKVYRATQDVAAGNMQSFGNLVQLASQMRGVPLAIHPAGNGQYVLLDPQGKPYGGAGTPADIAHFVFDQTPAATDIKRANAAAYAAKYYGALGESQGKVGADMQLENLKGQNEVQKAIVSGQLAQYLEHVKQQGMTLHPDPTGAGAYIIAGDGSRFAFVPTVTPGSNTIGLNVKTGVLPSAGGFK
jgi:hypothetical protein